MALEVFKKENRAWSPASLLADGLPLGFFDENGLVDNTSYTVDQGKVDQVAMSLGGAVVDIEGTVDFTLVEPTLANLRTAMGLPAASAITVPAAGFEVSAMPQRLLPSLFLEMWGLGPAGKTIYKCLTTQISSKSAINWASRAQTTLALQLMPVYQNGSHPLGFVQYLNAVDSGTATAISSSTPADSATDVAINATITLNFNRPLTALALDETIYSLVPAGGSAVAISVAFGTYSRNGKTCTNPYQLVITPTSSLTNEVVYTLTVPAAMPTVDGVPMAADDTVAFTTVAA